MRFLVCEWTAYMQQDMEDQLHKFGIDTVEYGYRWIGNFEKDDYFTRNFKGILEKEKDNIDAVISMNYMAPLAILCYEFGLPYIAWVYDCPFGMQHPEETLGLPTNHVFFFDRSQAVEFIDQGFDTVYHLPLAVNTERLDEITKEVDGYTSDVSFVGILYGSQFVPLRNHLPEYEGGYVDGLIKIQSSLYGAYVLRECLENSVDKKWLSHFSDVDEIQGMSLQTFRMWMETTLAKEITSRERRMILKILSERVHTCLYSPYRDDGLPAVDYKGVVSAYDEAPKVYRGSRINLNMTLKNLTSGIPLRALEILGSGGFLLSNYQPEIAENFINGKEVVMYESIEDAIMKALYYLSHEEERMEIAVNGRRAVERFSFDNQVRFMLETTFGTDIRSVMQ